MKTRHAPTARALPTVAALALTALCAVSVHAQTRPKVDLACVSFGAGPQLECTVRASRGGTPLDGAKVTLGATMPSMPMAHSVRPVAAAPTGRPGEYAGTLTLEMLGVWAVQVDLAGAARDRVVHTLSVVACDGDRRCPAAPARGDAAAAAHGTAAHGASGHGASGHGAAGHGASKHPPKH